MTRLCTLRRRLALACLAAGPLLTGVALAAAARQCPDGNGGLRLPPGFCATVFADEVGHARHMVAGPDGTLYVNTWSGRYYEHDQPREGALLLALRATSGSGHADRIERFGPTAAQGSDGGTGIALHGGYLYAEINDRIVRWPLTPGTLPQGEPETIVSGLPLDGDHPMHPFAIDRAGNLYVDLGSASNACQRENRQLASPGVDPCTELQTRGGVWRYDAGRPGQVFSPRERYATGIRNAVGIAVAPDGQTVYATQHGRDQLAQNWPRLYTVAQGAELPAEELMRLEPAGDYGWPECYYDGTQQRLVLAPEYGGDGGHSIGQCASKGAPVAAFPAHWGPNDVLVYAAPAFPKAFQGGAFIAFHGSWNRAPLPQGGYNIVFQPLEAGRASGAWIVFADGFAGARRDPEHARYRPSGLAVGADGALLVSDDQRGRIWRIDYRGPADAPLTGVATPGESAAGAAPSVRPARRRVAGLPRPPGVSRATLELGARIYQGEVGGAACTGCHGSEGGGTALGPSLTSGLWQWSDGSVAGLKGTIAAGVAQPKSHPGVMPAMGGTTLDQRQLDALADYVWALGHRRAPAKEAGARAE